MIKFLIVAFVLVALSVAAAGGGSDHIVNPDLQSDAEIRRVEEVAITLIAADNARDLERVVGVYASDAMLLPPDEPPVQGLSAIGPRYEAFFRTHHPAIVLTIEETVVAADLAYVRGRTRGSIRGLGGVADRSLNDVYIMILRRTEAGDWKISRLMWHSAGERGAQ